MMTKIKEGLILNVKLPPLPAARSMPCPVQATLVNAGQNAVIVNRRMALGYRENLARELFADLLTAGSRQPAEYRLAHYDRDFSPRSDYISLSPGEQISQTFDLFQLYLPAQAGDYVLVLHYQADEKLAHAPDGVVKGIISSEPVDFLVK